MSECGCSSNALFTGMDPVYKRALKWVIAINAAVFVGIRKHRLPFLCGG